VRDAPPYDGELALPGEHNRRNAGAALAALALLGVSRTEAAPALARFTGTGRRFEVHEAGDVTIVDDYGHHPTEVAAAIAAVRERFPGRRVRALFQPHLYSRTRHLAREFAGALATADDVTIVDVYPARELPLDGVTGKLIVDELSDLGVLAGWTPGVEQGVARLRRRAQPGDVLLVLGAGDVDRAVGMLQA
jgi:UDP-N-acetylmuramate--alanine ligase